jgi:hypothetical protein
MPIDIATTSLSGGGVLGALVWVWKKVAATEDKMTALELKIAQEYVNKETIKWVSARLDVHEEEDKKAFTRLEDKIDHGNETINGKIDTILNILLTKKD